MHLRPISTPYGNVQKNVFFLLLKPSLTLYSLETFGTLKLSNPERFRVRIPLAPMEVLAPVSAHAELSAQPPIGTSGIFPARVSAESPSNISPNPSEVISEVSEVYDNF